ncbi:MAG: 5-formyltetrahydrofolate cyclo-ligase [Selenomonadaceae bacterium]|nr:5-formyltetrahydrofolate cyclo-ligase [Selenomonadaceae bacterium]MBR6710157.1 5-formyltetrahydrofolate cyclo-ligase [Selenomonadaceae bacterium]
MENKDMHILATKKDLRKRVRRLRSAIPAQERQILSSRMTAELSRQFFFQDAKVIMAYASMLEEVQLYDLMRFSLDIGKKVCIPFILGRGIMDAVELHGMEDLVEDDYSILTVREDRRKVIDPSSIGCVVVPGVAFSSSGARLGLGGGYYDRFLSEKAPYAYRVVLAFECQIVEDIPLEPHDIPIDFIITEKRTIHCMRNR